MKTLTFVPESTESILGYIYLAIELTVLQPILLLVTLLIDVPVSDAVFNFIYFSTNFLFVTILLHKFLIRSGKQALSNPFQILRGAFLGLLFYWVGSIVINIIIQMISPDFFNVNDDNISQMTRDNYVLMAIGTVLLVPITEETLFRGLIFGKLYNRSPILAYILSTLVFCAIHVVGYIGLYDPMHLVLCLLQYIPPSICLGWAYAKTDNIWAPILIHMTINQIAMFSRR